MRNEPPPKSFTFNTKYFFFLFFLSLFLLFVFKYAAFSESPHL